MPKKKRTWELFEQNGLKLPPDIERAKKDQKSGNNVRRRPKGQRKTVQ